MFLPPWDNNPFQHAASSIPRLFTQRGGRGVTDADYRPEEAEHRAQSFHASRGYHPSGAQSLQSSLFILFHPSSAQLLFETRLTSTTPLSKLVRVKTYQVSTIHTQSRTLAQLGFTRQRGEKCRNYLYQTTQFYSPFEQVTQTASQVEHTALHHYLFFRCSLTEKHAQASHTACIFTFLVFPFLDNYLIYETTSKFSQAATINIKVNL